MRRTDVTLVALLALVYAPGVVALARVWASVDYYSHGFLVPLVALWAAARTPGAWGPPGAEREGRGLALLAVATGLYGLGLVAGSASLQGLALVAAVAGVVLYLWGGAGLRARAFPVAFLLFMVPLPDPWLKPLIVELQLLVSRTAVGLLQAGGVAVERVGNVLELAGGESLFVAEACSGITSIVTLVPLALVLGYFTERSWGRRAALLAAVVPAAMLGNLVRVVFTVAAADAYGVERATGNALHESAGLLTFVLACLALIGLGSLMRRMAPPRLA